MIGFIIRQRGSLVFLLLLFALLNGAYVCEGLWQGSGLHGYVLQHGARQGTGSPYVVSTWGAFVQMLLFTGLAGMPLAVNLWRTIPIKSNGAEPAAPEVSAIGVKRR